MINSLVCEGCGDCGKKSFCVSVLPKETEFGRKREIDQSNCNKDYSLRQRLLPELRHRAWRRAAQEERHGQRRSTSRRPAGADAAPTSTQPWNILITGVGGTGVVTIGALLGMAGAPGRQGRERARPDRPGAEGRRGHHAHPHRAGRPADIHAVRIAAGEADLVLGCDMVVVNDYWALSKIRAGRTQVVLNSYEAMPGTFTTRPDMQFPAHGHRRRGRIALGGDDAARWSMRPQLATALMGDAIATNLFILGYAWQQGLVPLSFDALMRAVELNGAAIEMNKTAFAWGRLAAIDPAGRARSRGHGAQRADLAEDTPHELPMLSPGEWEGHEWGANVAPKPTRDEDELRHVPAHGGSDAARSCRSTTRACRVRSTKSIARRVAFLTEYQNAALREALHAISSRRCAPPKQQRAPGSTDLTEAVARYAFKLMAYKDEYEVARLYTSGDFKRRVEQQFDGDYKLHFHLAPPLLAKKDAEGRLIKREYGPWVFTAFKLAGEAALPARHARSTCSATPRSASMERQLIGDYFATVEDCWSTARRRQRRRWRREIASMPGTHPRLRPRQGSAPARGQGARGGVAGEVEEGLRAGNGKR